MLAWHACGAGSGAGRGNTCVSRYSRLAASAGSACLRGRQQVLEVHACGAGSQPRFPCAWLGCQPHVSGVHAQSTRGISRLAAGSGQRGALPDRSSAKSCPHLADVETSQAATSQYEVKSPCLATEQCTGYSPGLRCTPTAPHCSALPMEWSRLWTANAPVHVHMQHMRYFQHAFL